MNPLIFRKGVCDPHIHIFQGKAYLYATHDAPGWENDFHMDDWQIWYSEDLVDWKLETVICPEDFYCGALNQCWALDAACKEEKYYLYYSTGDWGVGVAVSDRPAGPFIDPLGKALVDYRSYPEGVPKWDPCVFQDEDGEAYLIVGTCRQEKPWDCYLIARLESDMIHLAEPLRRLEYEGNPWPEDKASIHKYNGRYYLTHSSYYAVSDRVYGPYRYMGNTGCNIDHGSFFSYYNQTYFASGGMDNPNRYLRTSYLAPCHYYKNGEIVIDQKIVGYGCGQYDAAWDKINAAWYFSSSRECKEENWEGGFQTRLFSGEYLHFPNITGIEENAQMEMLAFAPGDVVITIREDCLDGPVLGMCRVGRERKVYRSGLLCPAGQKSLYLITDGEVVIQWFAFPGQGKRCTLEPVFSRVGRGASLAFDPDASNHQVLQNMELRGASMEALADGGGGGEGTLMVPYFCRDEDTRLEVHINGEYQGRLFFSAGSRTSLGKNPCESKVKIHLCPGLNRIRLYSREYQRGKLAIDHVTVESPKSPYGVYGAADGVLEPRGNGCWDGFPQRETDPLAYGGRVVKYLEKPGDRICLHGVEGVEGGSVDLEIHYCRGEEGTSSYRICVDGKEKTPVHFPCTGGFSLQKEGTQKVELTLEKGYHTLILEKTEKQDKGVYVDAFSVIPSVH